MGGLDVVRELAAGQWGMVTAQQAAAAGVSRQRLSRWAGQGSLTLVGHGLYRVPDAPETTHEEIKAAWLHLDRGRLAWDRVDDDQVDVVSHESAAAVHGLGTVPADQIVFTTARRRQSRDPRIRFHRAEVPERDQALVDGLPVTTPARTLVDLALRGTGWDESHLAEAARDVVVGHRVRPASLARRLDPVAGRFNAGSGEDLLDRWLADSGANDELAELLAAPALDAAVASAVARALPRASLPVITGFDGPALAAARGTHKAMSWMQPVLDSVREATSLNIPALRAFQAMNSFPALQTFRAMDSSPALRLLSQTTLPLSQTTLPQIAAARHAVANAAPALRVAQQAAQVARAAHPHDEAEQDQRQGQEDEHGEA